MRHYARLIIVVMSALALFSSACGGGTEKVNPVGPTPVFTTVPELDNSVRRLVDGVGEPGLLTVRLISVNPPPGSLLISGVGGDFEAEICLDPFANPRNNVFLAQANIIPIWSENGDSPLGSVQNPFLAHFSVASGECKTVSGPVSIVFPIPRSSRYLMFVGRMGPNRHGEWHDKPCPAPTEPWREDASGAACFLRTAYDLHYRW